MLVLALAAALMIPSAAMSAPAPKEIILGKSKIIVPPGALVGAQVDRVTRDTTLPDGSDLKNAYPFRVVTDKSGLVTYMEGRLAGQLIDYAKVQVVGLGPAYAKLVGETGDFYTEDGAGNFKFRVDPSKLNYSSVLYADKRSFAVMIDTHGFNAVAAPAIHLAQLSKKKLSLVIACMDLPSKAEAALFLAQNGINCYGPCDLFGSQIVGYKKDNPNAATVLGTAPIRKLKKGGAVIGNQSVRIALAEEIVVQKTDNAKYPDQYCDAPYNYFRAVQEKLGLALKLTPVVATIGQTDKLVAKAKEVGAQVIGVRVLNEKDAAPIAAWLKENPKNRAILFHSAAYEPGYDLFFQFPKQTSFGDLNPQVL
jgi:hypothetical protein